MSTECWMVVRHDDVTDQRYPVSSHRSECTARIAAIAYVHGSAAAQPLERAGRLRGDVYVTGPGAVTYRVDRTFADATPPPAGEYTAAPIVWEHTGDAEFPYEHDRAPHYLNVRVNDFPAEPMYTLLVDGVEVTDLDEWPPRWVKSTAVTAGTLRIRAVRICAAQDPTAADVTVVLDDPITLGDFERVFGPGRGTSGVHADGPHVVEFRVEPPGATYTARVEVRLRRTEPAGPTRTSIASDVTIRARRTRG